MIVSEIFIENKRLDITGDISALLTFAIDDVRDFAARNTTFSKTIVLPGTANNNFLFGHIFKATVSNPYDSSDDNISTNFNAAVAADCIMFQNHVQVFKGTLRLLEIVVDKGVPEYEVAVFGELAGLVGALGAGKLEDLDFSAYDHVWSAANITASWDAAQGTGYFYPLIDFGAVSINKIDYDIRALRPALYVREYIDKMLTGAGYTFSSDLFETARFKSLVIPNNQKSLQTVTDRLVQGVSVINNQLIIQDGVAQEAVIPQELRVVSGFTYLAGVYTYTGVDTKTFKFNGVVNGNYYSTIESVQIQVKKNGSQVYTGVPFLTPTFGTTDVSFTHTIPDTYVTLATGDTIELSAKVANNVGSYRMRTTFVRFEIYNSVPIFVDLTPGGTITINDTIPRNILQKDFLSSILKLFNLYVYEDKFTPKKLLIKPYVDFYDLNVSGVVDWNYKLDRSRSIRLRPMSELNSRFYDFKFKPDSDYYNELYQKTYNETYGDRLYDSEFEFANEREEVPLILSPSVLVGYAGVDKIVPALYKKNAGVEEPLQTNIRILQTKKITGVAAWDIEDAGVDLSSNLTNYGYGGHYDDPDAPANDIHFGVPRELFFTLLTGAISVTQFNVYWSPYMAEITDKDSKLMVAWFKLTTKDIYDLDFSKLIHVDGSYWRLNKIEDWNASQPDVCKVELLKLINMTY